MPDYRQKSTVRNYLSRREQWRILLPVMSLGLVVVLMFEASQPSNWEWLWAGVEKQAEANHGEANHADRSETLDTRFPPRNEDLAQGVVRIVGRPPAGKNSADGDFFLGVNVEGLREVRDNVMHLYLPDEDDPERKVWFNLLDILNNTVEAKLREESTEVTFAQLFQQSGTYRGKLVTIKGYVHRALPRKPTKNNVGIEDYFELWVSVGRQSTSVYCLQLPDDFPRGERISEEVEITGFFYKRVGFLHPPLEADSRDTTGDQPELELSLTPVLLARTVHWKPREQAKTKAAPNVGYFLAAGGAGIVFALAFTWWVFTRNRRPIADGRVPKEITSLDSLRPQEPPRSVEESMKTAMKDQQ